MSGKEGTMTPAERIRAGIAEREKREKRMSTLATHASASDLIDGVAFGPGPVDALAAMADALGVKNGA